MVPALAMRNRRRVHSAETVPACGSVDRPGSRPDQDPKDEERCAHGNRRVDDGERRRDQRHPDRSPGCDDAERHEDQRAQAEATRREHAGAGRHRHRHDDHQQAQRRLVVRAEQRDNDVLGAGGLEVDCQRPGGDDQRRRADEAGEELGGGDGHGARGGPGEGGSPPGGPGALTRLRHAGTLPGACDDAMTCLGGQGSLSSQRHTTWHTIREWAP